MTSLWATNLQSGAATTERLNAPDVARLRAHVDKFDTPYVEVRLHEHLERIQSRWSLLSGSLAVIAEQQSNQLQERA